MSTWTSSAALLLALGLAACVGGGGQRTATIGEGAAAFVVAAPAGYCTAPEAVSRNGRSSFAAFARCAPGGEASPVLTATVGQPGSARPLEPRAVATFFTGAEGRRALSRGRDARSVTVHEVLAVDGIILIRLTDRSPGSPGEGESWRAVMTAETRLVTLSLTGGRGAPLTRGQGRMLALAFARAVQRANGVAA